MKLKARMVYLAGVNACVGIIKLVFLKFYYSQVYISGIILKRVQKWILKKIASLKSVKVATNSELVFALVNLRFR